MDTTPTKSEEEKIREFMAASKARWQERLTETAEDDVARLQLGYWTFAFSIVGASSWTSLNHVRRDMEQAWPRHLRQYLFEEKMIPGIAPYATENAIEAWTGDPVAGRYRSPFRCSFWRASADGQFYHLKGFQADSQPNRVDPGTAHFHNLSIEQHVMMLHLATRIASEMREHAELVICSEMTGLKGRYLCHSEVPWSPVEALEDGWISSIDTVKLQPQRLTPQRINDNLVEILYDFLYPLYEKFNFCELNRGQVEATVVEAKRRGW